MEVTIKMTQDQTRYSCSGNAMETLNTFLLLVMFINLENKIDNERRQNDINKVRT